MIIFSFFIFLQDMPKKRGETKFQPHELPRSWSKAIDIEERRAEVNDYNSQYLSPEPKNLKIISPWWTAPIQLVVEWISNKICSTFRFASFIHWLKLLSPAQQIVQTELLHKLKNSLKQIGYLVFMFSFFVHN